MIQHSPNELVGRGQLWVATAFGAALIDTPAAATENLPLSPASTHASERNIILGQVSHLQQVLELQTVANVSGAVPQLEKSAPSLGSRYPLDDFGVDAAKTHAPSAPTTIPPPWTLAAAAVARENIGSRGSSPHIFGSTAVLVKSTPYDRKWSAVVHRTYERKKSPWLALAQQIRDYDDAAKMDLVNKWVNARLTFSDDLREYQNSDHWADAAQALKRGRGDCEDFAITKMQILRSVGFASEDLYISVVDDLVRRSKHAVLVVRLQGRLLVLDNNTDIITDASVSSDYRPILTFAANGSWTHGYRQDRATRGFQGGDLLHLAAR